MGRISIYDLNQLEELDDAELSKVVGGRVRFQQGRLRLDDDLNEVHSVLDLDQRRYTFGIEKTWY